MTFHKSSTKNNNRNDRPNAVQGQVAVDSNSKNRKRKQLLDDDTSCSNPVLPSAEKQQKLERGYSSTSSIISATKPDDDKKNILHEGNGKPYVTDDGVHLKALLQFPKYHHNCRYHYHRHHNPPKVGRRYILQRAMGDDVLQVVREHEMEGYLELVPSQRHQDDGDDNNSNSSNNNNNDSGIESANLYLKFPYHQGIIAGRLDNVTPIFHYNKTNSSKNENRVTEEEPCFFTMVCCHAYVNYGTWEGTVERGRSSSSKSQSSTSPLTTTATTTTTTNNNNSTTGLHFAEAGHERTSAKNPYYVDRIHSMEVLQDQPDERDVFDKSQHYLFPPGYRRLTKGCLNFTLFLKRYYEDKEEDWDTTLGLIFRPETELEQRNNQPAGTMSSSMIPPHILEEINKLPPSRHINKQNLKQNNNKTREM